MAVQEWRALCRSGSLARTIFSIEVTAVVPHLADISFCNAAVDRASDGHTSHIDGKDPPGRELTVATVAVKARRNPCPLGPTPEVE